jgi:hypothetical protein
LSGVLVAAASAGVAPGRLPARGQVLAHEAQPVLEEGKQVLRTGGVEALPGQIVKKGYLMRHQRLTFGNAPSRPLQRRFVHDRLLMPGL